MSSKPRSVFALPLFLGLLAFPAAPGAAEAAGTMNTTRAHVVDADGKIIGTLIGQNRILINFPDGDAVVGFDRYGYLPLPPNFWSSSDFDDTAAFYFEGKNCRGQPYALQRQAPGLGYFDGNHYMRPLPTPALYYTTRESTTKQLRSRLAPPVLFTRAPGQSSDNNRVPVFPPCKEVDLGSPQPVVPVSKITPLPFKAPVSIEVRPN